MRSFLAPLLLLVTLLSCSLVLAESPPAPEPISYPLNEKVDSVFSYLASNWQLHQDASLFEKECKKLGIKCNGMSVLVTVYIPSPNTTAVVSDEDLDGIGFDVRAKSKNYIEGYLHVGKIDEMAKAHPEISLIRRVIPLRANSYTSEGVNNIIGATTWMNNGNGGSGIRIAIIDLGFSGVSSAVSNGDFGSYTSQDFTGSGFPGTNVHGMACAEIVYDLVPNATYYLLKVSSSAHLQNALSYCITNNIDVVSASIGWPNSNFCDGQSQACTDVNSAVNNGIFVVFSAGNEGENKVWTGNWSDTNTDNWLEYSGTDQTQDVFCLAGTTLSALLTWDTSLSNSNQNYDLYLYDNSMTLLTSSTLPQNGSQQPIEAIQYSITTTGTYHVSIWRSSANGTSKFRLWVDNGFPNPLEYGASAYSIASPGDSTGAFTVGAISYTDWLQFLPSIQSYSSRGPTMDGRIKPDICGPDDVSTFSYSTQSPPTFPGTSAACPHVAAIAALFIEQYATATPAQIRSQLEAWAYDCGTRGKDNDFGHGEIQLYNIPPIASFNGAPNVIKAGEYVNFFDHSGGLIKTWSWNFGDTGTSSLQDPTHMYSTSGIYSVSLTVSGPAGSDTATKTSYVQVTPKADFSATPRTGPGSLSVTFTDMTVGTATGWNWNFGDGQSSTQQNPTHIYTTAGTFAVSLSVTGPHGNDSIVKTDYITVGPPTCDFSANQTGGTGTLAVSFTSQVTGTVSTYLWDFGDGNTSATQNASHNYTPGAYTVSLTVSGPTGTAKEEKTSYITVFTPPPTIVTEKVEGGGCSCSPTAGTVESNRLIGLLLPYLVLAFVFIILKYRRCLTSEQ